MADVCNHYDWRRAEEPRLAATGCEECQAAGTSWVHLRACLGCGHVGCCDSSPGRHATRHHEASGHPVMQSMERGEDWGWCYLDRVYLNFNRKRYEPAD